jgi:hypothetical protein
MKSNEAFQFDKNKNHSLLIRKKPKVMGGIFTKHHNLILLIINKMPTPLEPWLLLREMEEKAVGYH